MGVCYGHDVPRMQAVVHTATRITHTDLKAQYGASAVALAAHFAAMRRNVSGEAYLAALQELCGAGAGILPHVRAVVESVGRGESAERFAAAIGCAKGVSGFIYHTVPVALHVWLRRQADFRGALLETVRLGGDTDTVAAVVGALVGTRVGRDGIPEEWLRDLSEWPRTPEWMERLGVQLAGLLPLPDPVEALPLNAWKLLLRNALFIPLVLAHGLRRLLPPY